MKTALFAGSFNPFTIGHKSIADRTLASLADRLVIAVGYNPAKADPSDVAERVRSISLLFQDDPRVEVLAYDSLTVQFAKQCQADFLVRGVRSLSDFEYELQLADANRDLSGIETVILPPLPELAFVSSSLVRELKAFGQDPSKYLP